MLGLRPTATSTTSTSSVALSPPATGSMLSHDALVSTLGAGDLGAKLEGDFLAPEKPVHLSRDLAVHPGQDAVEELDHRDLGTEAAPDRAHFEADVATADHGHTRRHLRQRERTGGGDDALLVHVHAGERCGDAPGRDHHRTGRDSAGLRALDLDRAGACEARVALQVGHVVCSLRGRRRPW